MTTALATLFRIGLSRGREIISVEQEAQHVGSYLQIQKLRYGGKLSYTVELSPDILQLYTVKLILQPLVENAIYHGIKESEAPGLIAISGRRSGSVMELRVTDNGWPCCRQTLRAAFPSAGRGTAFSTSTNVSGCILAQSTD